MKDFDKKEAIKLLFDWNKWLVGIETIAISALGFIFRLREGVNEEVLVLASISLICFLISIYLSSMLLLNLPFMAGNTENLNEGSFQDNKVYFASGEQELTGKEWTVGNYTAYITRTFGLGLLAFVLALMSAFYLKL